MHTQTTTETRTLRASIESGAELLDDHAAAALLKIVESLERVDAIGIECRQKGARVFKLELEAFHYLPSSAARMEATGQAKRPLMRTGRIGPFSPSL